MKKLTRFLLLILAVMMVCTACAKPEPIRDAEITPMPAPEPEPTPEPTPEPVVFDEAAANARLEELITEGMKIDVSDFAGMPENMFAEEDEWNIHGTDQADREWLPNLPKELDKKIYDAVEPIVREFMEADTNGSYTAELEWEMNYETPNWQLIYTLLKGADSSEHHLTASHRIAIGARVVPPDKE